MRWGDYLGSGQGIVSDKSSERKFIRVYSVYLLIGSY